MPRTVSVGTMIEQIDGLHGSTDMLRKEPDLTEWEEGFVNSVVAKYKAASKDSTTLSDKQVAIVERIWRKHFA